MADQSSNKTFKERLKRIGIKGGIALVGAIIALIIIRSLIISIFIADRNPNQQMLSDVEVQACNLNWQKLGTELQAEFQRTISNPADRKLQKNYWYDWHNKWDRHLEQQKKNCLINNKQGQYEQFKNLTAIDRGYELMMKSYLKTVLPELIKRDNFNYNNAIH